MVAFFLMCFEINVKKNRGFLDITNIFTIFNPTLGFKE